MKDFFRKRIETATFKLPDSDTNTHCQVEFRIDPLTGRTSVICESLLRKVAILYGQTDHALISSMVRESQKNCIFCPPAVFKCTPVYTQPLGDNTRMQSASSILFPNLFPTAGLHSVLTWPDHHFLRPGEFSTELLSDLFLLTGRFASDIRKHAPEIDFLTLNCNYMPPAGASIVHPHFQLVGNREAPHRLSEICRASGKWWKETGNNYWDALCAAEKTEGKRWIADCGPWSWIAAWSPSGANEILGIHHSAPTVFDLTGPDWIHLAEGLNSVLKNMQDRDCSSFNLCLSGGLQSDPEGQRCVLRIISRQNVKPDYRNDEYFLQKFHGVELIVLAPEELADELKRYFR